MAIQRLTQPGGLHAFPPRRPFNHTMHITLYKRTFAVKDAPVSLSLTPFPVGQVHTFPVGGRVYTATYSEMRVTAPDDAKVDVAHNRLLWGEGKGKGRATAKEVFDLATAGTAGFRMSKAAISGLS